MNSDNTQKRIKGATWFFVSLIVIYLAVAALFNFTRLGTKIGIVQNIIMSQSMIFIPALVYIIVSRCSFRDTLRIRRTHWSAIFIVPVFVVALEPLMTVINSISLLWVDSATTELSVSLVAKYPFWVSTALMALTPCIVEELAYRGIILGNFRCGSRIWAIVISGIMFGAMHMNFNQMAYAVVLGIMLGLLAEATGSILTTMLAHFCFNEISVVISYITWHNDVLKESAMASLDGGVSNKQMLATVIMMMPAAIGGLCVALALLYTLSVINDRKDEVLGMFRRSEHIEGQKTRIISVPLVVSLVVCIAVMTIGEILL